MPLTPMSLRLHRLKTSQDFSFKWEKVPQSVSSLQMSPLHASEGRTQAVKWSRMQGKGCYHVKDRLCICKKGCFITCPISSSCCHGIGRRWFDRTSARLKYMAWIPGWQCAGVVKGVYVVQRGTSAHCSLITSPTPILKMRSRKQTSQLFSVEFLIIWYILT